MLERLRLLRGKSGYTQVDMANSLSISKQFYSQIERGERRLSYDMAVAIAKIFHKTPDDIFLPAEYTLSGLKQSVAATGTEG